MPVRYVEQQVERNCHSEQHTETDESSPLLTFLSLSHVRDQSVVIQWIDSANRRLRLVGQTTVVERNSETEADESGD